MLQSQIPQLMKFTIISRSRIASSRMYLAGRPFTIMGLLITSDTKQPILGLFFAGLQINSGYSDSLKDFRGRFSLDLYANGAFHVGDHVTLEVVLGNGSKLNGAAAITGGAP